MNGDKTFLPRKIWILWYQGLAEAPFIVKECVDSWVRENPKWEVIVLDSSNINKYVTEDVPEEKVRGLSAAHKSDLLRLALLSKYGGVWADATTFCNKPLDDWLHKYSKSGFFVFCYPGRDRLISNWFIASEKDNLIIRELYKELKLYWIKYDFSKPNRIQEYMRSKLSSILNRSTKTTKYWFNPVVTQFLRIYPYYVFHYIFERIVSIDKDAKVIWDNTQRLSAKPPHWLKRHGLLSEPSSEVKELVDSKEIPLFKLTWKYDHTKYNQKTLLYYLIENNRTN